MKKILVFMLIMIGAIVPNQVNAQGVYLGVKGGLNVANIDFPKEIFDANKRAGWYIGPSIRIGLPLSGFEIEAAVLYDYRAARVGNIEFTHQLDNVQTIAQKQIAVPLNLRASLPLGPRMKAFIFAGPQFGFNVGDKNFKWERSAEYSLKETNLSANVGLGLTLYRHLEITANANLALGKTGEINVKDVIENASQKLKGAIETKTNAFQIGLAYYF